MNRFPPDRTLFSGGKRSSGRKETITQRAVGEDQEYDAGWGETGALWKNDWE
ncbi:uncharacterized protein V6R79_010532 [Siganus canaliculatus]